METNRFWSAVFAVDAFMERYWIMDVLRVWCAAILIRNALASTVGLAVAALWVVGAWIQLSYVYFHRKDEVTNAVAALFGREESKSIA